MNNRAKVGDERNEDRYEIRVTVIRYIKGNKNSGRILRALNRQ